METPQQVNPRPTRNQTSLTPTRKAWGGIVSGAIALAITTGLQAIPADTLPAPILVYLANHTPAIADALAGHLVAQMTPYLAAIAGFYFTKEWDLTQD